MHVLGAVDLASLLDVAIGRERFHYKAAQLFFIGSVPFHSFDNQAMGGPTRLFSQGTEPCPQFWREANSRGGCHRDASFFPYELQK
jgi:hypothetical protein